MEPDTHRERGTERLANDSDRYFRAISQSSCPLAQNFIERRKGRGDSSWVTAT